MKRFNVVLVYNKDMKQVLMCERTKEPYKGKLNLVGGKVGETEDGLEAAYRELEEETGIPREDISLVSFTEFWIYDFRNENGSIYGEIK